MVLVLTFILWIAAFVAAKGVSVLFLVIHHFILILLAGGRVTLVKDIFLNLLLVNGFLNFNLSRIGRRRIAFWIFTLVFSFTKLEFLLGRRVHASLLNPQPAFAEIVVVFVGIPLVLRAPFQVTGLCFPGTLGVKALRATVDDQFLPLLIEDWQVDSLLAKHGQFHSFFNQASLPLAVGHIPTVVVLNLHKGMYFPFSH